ncbi:hypothetical protein [Mucilaginibacter sp.]
MKVQFVNIEQTFFDISNLMITGVKSLNLNKLFSAPIFSTKKVGHYLLPLVKQLLRDNFIGSDMEMTMMLTFMKGYFLSATEVVRNNTISDLFKKFGGSKNTIAVLNSERVYNHEQAA